MQDEERTGVDFDPQLGEAFTGMMRLWSYQRVVMPTVAAPPPPPSVTPPPLPPPPG